MTGAEFVAWWPVSPDANANDVLAHARRDLVRMAELAGVALDAEPTFTVVPAGQWAGRFGDPGDDLLIANTAAHAVTDNIHETGEPEPSVNLDFIPVDVLLRETGNLERPRRVDEVLALVTREHNPLPAGDVAAMGRVTIRTVERLKVEARARRAS